LGVHFADEVDMRGALRCGEWVASFKMRWLNSGVT